LVVFLQSVRSQNGNPTQPNTECVEMNE
jgi:hypothetical protein